MKSTTKLLARAEVTLLFLIVTAATLALVKCSTAGTAPASATPGASTACPDLSLGETEQDCPWAGDARALIAEARSSSGDAAAHVSEKLSQLLPDLDASLKADAKRAAWKRLWGKSVNFDENAKGVIVDPAILKALADKMKIPAGPMDITYIQAPKPSQGITAGLTPRPGSWPTDSAGHQIVHAGMEHTYGYLFSVLKTPFGYKRARWVEGEIARGFGLPEGLLSPRPSEGTLFANVTYFAGNIAFRDEPTKTALLKKSAQGLPKALVDFDFASLKTVRLEESVTARDETGDVRNVVLRTDLVPLSAPQKNTHLLVYSVKDPARGGAQLITAFPVMSGFVDAVLKPEDLGNDRPVQSRYNAFVEGVTGQTLRGSRKVVK